MDTRFNLLPPRAGVWLAGALGAALAGGALAVLSGTPPALAIAGGLVATCILTALPFRWTMTIVIVASGFTEFEISGLPVHLRADIVLVPAALLCCGLHHRMQPFFSWLRHPVMLLLFSYVAVQFAASAFSSPDPGKSFSVATWLLLDVIIVALALACFGEDRAALMSRLAFTGALIVASGLFGWAYTRYLGGEWGAGYDPAYGLRANGIAFEPNILAGTAAVWTVIILTKGVRLRWIDWLFVLGSIAVIPMTTTRAAPVAIAAGLMVYFAREIRRSSRIILIGTTAVATAVAVQLVAPGNWSAIVAKLSDFSDQTAIHRTSSWQVALQDIHGWNWLFGLGTNSFGQRHVDPTLVAQQVPGYLGNLPLQTLYDSGAVGLALLLAAAWILMRRGDRARRFAVLVTFLVIASATSPFFFGNWWLFIALGLAQQAYGVQTPRQVGATFRRQATSIRSSLVPQFAMPKTLPPGR